MFFFFFHATPTTEIYTYFHTLSLHDALPIFIVLLRQLSPAAIKQLNPSGMVTIIDQVAPSLAVSTSTKPPWLVMPRPTGLSLRSEEHTSELQSLMRISYAVFCLKKKKLTNTRRQLASRTAKVDREEHK